MSAIEIQHVSLDGCGEAEGAVVAIDVFRAFTTAAYAFDRGAARIILVGTVEEALERRKRLPDALLMGEVNGLPIKGFDFGNSPTAIATADLRGRTLVERTSAGTQGIVRSERAEILLASSFCCARATVDYLRRVSPARVTFVITGWYRDDETDALYGDEDVACADYMQALLREQDPDPQPFLDRATHARAASKFLDPGQPDFPESDFELALAINRFHFAMVAHREQGDFVLHRVPMP